MEATITNESCQCPECGEPRPDDDRVAQGMKCGLCAYGDHKEASNENV